MAHFLSTFLMIFRVTYFTQFHIEMLEFAVQKKSQKNAKNDVEKYVKNATYLEASRCQSSIWGQKMTHFLSTFLVIFRVTYFTQCHIEMLEFVVQKKSQKNAKNGAEKCAKSC